MSIVTYDARLSKFFDYCSDQINENYVSFEGELSSSDEIEIKSLKN